jgi:hypothetical protein
VASTGWKGVEPEACCSASPARRVPGRLFCSLGVLAQIGPDLASFTPGDPLHSQSQR